MNINLVARDLPQTGQVRRGGGKQLQDKVGTPVARPEPTKAEPAARERPVYTTQVAASKTMRVELDVHKATGRIVGRVVDQSTNQVIRELPPEDILRYLERTAELFDKIIRHGAGLAIDKRV